MVTQYPKKFELKQVQGTNFYKIEVSLPSLPSHLFLFLSFLGPGIGEWLGEQILLSRHIKMQSKLN